MKKHDDPNYVAKVEKAIAKKYGEEAVRHPRSNWDDEKEADYLEQIKKLAEKERKKRQKVEKIEKDGFLISKKLLKKRSTRNCSVCGVYSFDIKDDVYMTKFSCCWICYVNKVRGVTGSAWPASVFEKAKKNKKNRRPNEDENHQTNNNEND